MNSLRKRNDSIKFTVEYLKKSKKVTELKQNKTIQKMKQLRKSIYFIAMITLLIPTWSFSQNIAQNDSVDIKLMIAAREIITAAGTCALITLDENNLPMVRAMSPFLPESDFTVWFGTNPKSRKVNQIKKNPNVTLYYLDSDASGYVVIHGKAHLVDDKNEKEKHWKPEWDAFYPNKTDAYLLIRVSPESMEISSNQRGITADPETWQTPVVKFDSKD